MLPLLSTDQWANAAAVARGQRIALDDDHGARGALGLPPGDLVARLGPAVCVLSDAGYRREVARMAAAAVALPPVDTAVAVLRGYAT